MKDETKKSKAKINKIVMPTTGAACKSIRKQLGLNQTDFWSKFGVTQSGGSRYEGRPDEAAKTPDRDRPAPLKMLMALWLAGKISDADLEWAKTIAEQSK